MLERRPLGARLRLRRDILHRRVHAAAIERHLEGVRVREAQLAGPEHGELEHVAVAVDALEPVLGLARRDDEVVVVGQPPQVGAHRLGVVVARAHDEEVVVAPLVDARAIGGRAGEDEARHLGPRFERFDEPVEVGGERAADAADVEHAHHPTGGGGVHWALYTGVR